MLLAINLILVSLCQVVEGTLLSEVFPVDDDGIYFVLTSADVAEVGGFCSSYCGWHTFLQWDSQVRPTVLCPAVAFCQRLQVAL